MPSQPDLHLDFPYAERAPDAAVRRIRADLALIAEEVARADPHVRALVLTGGFSRGEGTVRDGAPVNDYDLVAIRDRPFGGARLRRVAHDLTERIGLEVDLMPVWRARLPFVGRKLFWLDVRLGGRVVMGDARELARVRRFDAAEVDRAEIARLLGNRAAGLLLALPGPGEPEDLPQRDLQAAKAALAAMDATLLHEGRYGARLRDRLAMSRGHPDHALFALAVEWKLSGGEGVALPDDWWDQAAACLLRAVDATRAREMRDGWVEHAFYALRARRVRLGPSRAVRQAAWDLLAESRWPNGPWQLPKALRHLAPAPEGAAWPALKAAFFRLRAMTLQ